MMVESKATLQPNHYRYVAALVVFFVGMLWLSLVGGNRGNMERQVAAAARRIPGEVPASGASALPLLRNQAAEKLVFYKSQWIAQCPLEQGPDGITLFTRVHSILHEFRGRLEQSGIESSSPNLGFEDFSREVALLTSESDFQSVAVSVDLLRDCMEMLIESRPIALESVRRRSHPAGTVFGFPPKEMSEFEGLGAVSLTVVFDGYTRSLRDFVNAIGDCRPGILITHLKVGRSPRSEQDHTSKLFVSSPVRAWDGARLRSSDSNPFAAFMSKEPLERAGDETQPLIGEVVSTFSLTLLRLHEL